METLLTEEGNFVIDTGANTFSNLLAYTVENEVFPILADAGKTTHVHTIIRPSRKRLIGGSGKP